VAVQVKDRPFVDVAADMVEGVLVVNRLATDAATRMRPVLAEAVEPQARQPEAA
jgi:hypothetical protein